MRPNDIDVNVFVTFLNILKISFSRFLTFYFPNVFSSMDREIIPGYRNWFLKSISYEI